MRQALLLVPPLLLAGCVMSADAHPPPQPSTTTPPSSAPHATVPPPTLPAPSGLAIVNVYGLRPGLDVGLNEVWVIAGVLPDADPVDLTSVSIRVQDAQGFRTYVFAAQQDNASSPPTFSLTCIRGTCMGGTPVMHAGDLAQLAFTLPPGTYLPPSTSVRMLVAPDSRAVTHADFTTPPDYWSDLVLTLR